MYSLVLNATSDCLQTDQNMRFYPILFPEILLNSPYQVLDDLGMHCFCFVRRGFVTDYMANLITR